MIALARIGQNFMGAPQGGPVSIPGGGVPGGVIVGNPAPPGPAGIISQGPYTVTPGPATGPSIFPQAGYPVLNFVCRPGKKDGLSVVCRYEESDLPAMQMPMGIAVSNAPMNGW